MACQFVSLSVCGTRSQAVWKSVRNGPKNDQNDQNDAEVAVLVQPRPRPRAANVEKRTLLSEGVAPTEDRRILEECRVPVAVLLMFVDVSVIHTKKCQNKHRICTNCHNKYPML